jgi:hypothetical protein
MVSGATAAQQDELDLGEPITRMGLFNQRNTFVWSDDGSTLYYEAEYDAETGEYGFLGFAYDVATGELSRLDESPLRLTFTEEEQAFYQAIEPFAYRSPVTMEAATRIIFASTLDISCGHECRGTLLMMGTHTTAEDVPSPGFYSPLDITLQDDFHMLWSRDGSAAVLMMDLAYGGGLNLYHVTLKQPYPILFIDSGWAYEHMLCDISADGTRVLYKQYGNDNATLMLWSMKPWTEAEPWVVALGSEAVVESWVAGANFVPDDANQIVYVDESGVHLYDLGHEIDTLVNPDINAEWVNYAVFSPDHRHVAVVTVDAELYVLPTGLDDSE